MEPKVIPPLSDDEKAAIDAQNPAYQCGECKAVYHQDDVLACDNIYCPMKKYVKGSK